MAKVTLSEYEWQNDLLPAVCAKCGEPAAEHVLRRTRFFSGPWALVQTVGVLIGLLLFPPLFFLIGYGFGRVLSVNIPMCSMHQNDWKWRDRATYMLLFPIWIMVVVAFDAIAIVKALHGDDDYLYYAAAGIVGFFIVLIIDNHVLGYRAVKLAVPDKAHMKLAGVHPDFVAAIVADRARDRIDNPNRRNTQRGIQDDYDDELD